MNKVLIISGQTGVGKTDLGVDIAKKYDGEIVSFDSRQVYKHLDIITGKDFDVNTPPQSFTINHQPYSIYFINKIPIWLYDLYDPKENTSAYELIQHAHKVIADIHSRNKLPIIVGGTMFYIKSFLEGFQTDDTEPDWDLRNELELKPVKELQHRLININPQRFEQMTDSDKLNKRRLIRAIEIGNAPIIDNLASRIQHHSYDILHIGLVAEKEILQQRIKKRVQKRLEQGALTEVQSLLDKGYLFTDPGLNSSGYKQLKPYFLNEQTLDEAVNKWILAELDHARRQQMLLRKIKNVELLEQKLITAENNTSEIIAKTEELVYKWR